MDAAAPPDDWAPATVVRRDLRLYPRRVPLPTREPLLIRRLVTVDRVKLPTVSISFRHKPYLVPPTELPRHNTFDTPAYLVTDIVSPVAQTLRFTPTRGAFDWYSQGRKLIAGNGWSPWPEGEQPVVIELAAGANRLVGVHKGDHFWGAGGQPLKYALTAECPFGGAAVRGRGARPRGQCCTRHYWSTSLNSFCNRAAWSCSQRNRERTGAVRT